MRIEEVLSEAENYMRKNRAANWRVYEHFKKLVGWIDHKEYELFIRKLTKILRVG